MNDTKKPLESKTIISGIISVVNGLVIVLVATGVLDDALGTQIMSQTPVLLDTLFALLGLVSTAGGFGAIYGRLKATASISL